MARRRDARVRPTRRAAEATSAVAYTVTKVVRRLGLPEGVVHVLRDTKATLAIRAGVPAHAHPSDAREAAHRANAVMFGTKVGSWMGHGMR